MFHQVSSTIQLGPAALETLDLWQQAFPRYFFVSGSAFDVDRSHSPHAIHPAAFSVDRLFRHATDLRTLRAVSLLSRDGFDISRASAFKLAADIFCGYPGYAVTFLHLTQLDTPTSFGDREPDLPIRPIDSIVEGLVSPNEVARHKNRIFHILKLVRRHGDPSEHYDPALLLCRFRDFLRSTLGTLAAQEVLTPPTPAQPLRIQVPSLASPQQPSVSPPHRPRPGRYPAPRHLSTAVPARSLGTGGSRGMSAACCVSDCSADAELLIYRSSPWSSLQLPGSCEGGKVGAQRSAQSTLVAA